MIIELLFLNIAVVQGMVTTAISSFIFPMITNITKSTSVAILYLKTTKNMMVTFLAVSLN